MSDRQAALEQALKQIEKQFGKGSIMKLGEQTDTGISTVSKWIISIRCSTRSRWISKRTCN